jgi:endoglucanase
MRSVASELSIPYALEPLTRSTGTEADVLSISGKGIPTILLSIPIRNMHSPVEVADLADVESSLKLLSAALQSEDLWSS